MKVSLRSKLMALVLTVLLLAVGLISYQSLKFFREDKATYVFDLISQVVVVQSQELDRKIVSLRNLMEIFSEMASWNLTVAERESMLKRYQDFLYLAVFQVQSGAAGPTLIDDLVIADRQRLQSTGIDTNSVKSDPRLLKLVQSGVDFHALNMTNKETAPVVGMVLQPNPQRVVVGLLAQNTILDISGTKKAYQAYVVDEQGDLVMHPDGMELLKRLNLAEDPMVASWLQNPELPLTREYARQGGSNILGAYAGLSKFPLGIFVEVPKEQAFLAARRLIKASSIWAGGIFLVACALGIAFAYRITRPLKQLSQLTRRIAQGDFKAQAEVMSNDELGELAGSFNLMGKELEIRDQKIEESNRQLVQGEKMSAFGQMSAGIAHEVKNPLAGILGYAQLAKRKLEENHPVIKHIDIIEKETKRCKEIIDNLMKFARQEKAAFELFNPNQAVRDAMQLVDHQITLHSVKIIPELADDASVPQAVGSANQLQQVLMNLMLNAQHAMEGGGTLTVRTRGEAGKAVIQVADTGHGIKPENLKKMFEPFFTTKAAGKGTGLGLAVSYGIIKEHRGEISIDSTVGVGTTFTIRLPAAGSKEAPQINTSAPAAEAPTVAV